MTSSDAPFEIAMAKAAHYAGLRGAKPAECEYVHRFNGYIQGFLEGKGAKYEEEQLEKIKAKECDHVSAVINWPDKNLEERNNSLPPDFQWTSGVQEVPKINSALAAFL